jgi:hypothetical protein
MARSNDPRTLLKKEEEVQEATDWSVRTDTFDTDHAKHIWDMTFQACLQDSLQNSHRGVTSEDKFRLLVKNIKQALVTSDAILQVYAEHRKANQHVFVAAAEIMSSPKES